MEDKEKEAREKIEEIKKRLKEIEEETGNKIDLEKVLRVLFTKENLKKRASKIILTLDKMLREDIKDYVEFGSQEKGLVKIEHGFRIRFLDDKKDDEEKEKKEKLKRWKEK